MRFLAAPSTPKTCGRDCTKGPREKCDCCRHRRPFGWAPRYCEPCVYIRMDRLAYAVYELMQACIKGIPVAGGMGGGTIVWELSTESLLGKLKAHGVPEHLWGEIDDLVAAAFGEFRSLSGKKAASFNPEAELELLGAWPKTK